jgi:hypothetical protein
LWLPPDQPVAGSDSAVTVAHELTHLVFNEATQNPYHDPPRWLNEGIAVYLSEGYSGQWQATVAGAVANDSIIPLDGLAGLFPSPYDEFYLAYGEAVASVDYFIRTYGDQKLWALVRSYAEGLSDDDAFSQAIGLDVEQFNAAWMSSLGVQVPAPLGPQPGLPGPVPSAWQVTGGPTTGPSGSPGAAGSPAPSSSPIPGSTVIGQPSPGPGLGENNSSQNDDSTRIVVLAIILLIVVLVAVLALVLVYQRTRPRCG